MRPFATAIALGDDALAETRVCKHCARCVCVCVVHSVVVGACDALPHNEEYESDDNNVRHSRANEDEVNS